MPQTPQGKERILRLDGSVVDEFGTVLTPPSSNPTPFGAIGKVQATGQKDIFEDPEGLAEVVTKGAATLLPLAVPGMSFPAIAARSLVSGGLMGAADEMKHQGDFKESALTSGLLNAGLETAGKAIPYVSTPLSLFLGSGLGGKEGPGITAASKAFIKENEKRLAQGQLPLIVGARGQSKNAMGAAGRNLEQVERSTPGSVPIRNLTGSSSNLMENAGSTAHPMDLRAKISEFDRDFLEQQVQERTIMPYILQHYGLTPADLPNLAPAAQQRIYAVTKRAWNQMNPQQKLAAIDRTELDVRALGELKRGVSGEAKPVLKARREGTFVPPDTHQNASISADLGKRADEAQAQFDTQGRIKEANQRFSDVATANSANEQVRHDLSMIIKRAAGGATVSGFTGGGIGLGGLLGLIADPSLVHGGGEALAELLKWLPTGIRGADTYDTATRVSRKKPQEKK